MTDELQQLGRYRLIRLLGSGSTGLVYEGFDPSQQRRVAIKTIHQSLLVGSGGQELLVRFRREAQACNSFSHRNIIAVYEYNEEQERPFISLELLHGCKLNKHVEQSGPLPLAQITPIINQTLDAVGYIHDKGVMHLDLKPANMLLLADNQIKIADFGSAQVIDCPSLPVGTITGTPS